MPIRSIKSPEKVKAESTVNNYSPEVKTTKNKNVNDSPIVELLHKTDSDLVEK